MINRLDRLPTEITPNECRRRSTAEGESEEDIVLYIVLHKMLMTFVLVAHLDTLFVQIVYENLASVSFLAMMMMMVVVMPTAIRKPERE